MPDVDPHRAWLRDTAVTDDDRRIQELETRLAFAIGMLEELLNPARSGWSGPYSEDWKLRLDRVKETERDDG